MIILVFVFVLRYFTCSESDETKKKKKKKNIEP